MPVVQASKAPVFTYSMPGVESPSGLPHLTVRGLASPSRGSTQTGVWRMTVAPQTPPRMGWVDHEEIFVVLSGRAAVDLDGVHHDLDEGDALIVPPKTNFGISNPNDKPAEMMVVLPVGGRAHDPATGQSFVPPWAE